jgi:hypothetical protein
MVLSGKTVIPASFSERVNLFCEGVPWHYPVNFIPWKYFFQAGTRKRKKCLPEVQGRFLDRKTDVSGLVGTTGVRRYNKGRSPYGAWDMAGNVWEWTPSDYDKRTRVVKGGSWGLTHRLARTFSRVGYSPETKVNNLGFRCAKDK